MNQVLKWNRMVLSKLVKTDFFFLFDGYFRLAGNTKQGSFSLQCEFLRIAKPTQKPPRKESHPQTKFLSRWSGLDLSLCEEQSRKLLIQTTATANIEHSGPSPQPPPASNTTVKRNETMPTKNAKQSRSKRNEIDDSNHSSEMSFTLKGDLSDMQLKPPQEQQGEESGTASTEATADTQSPARKKSFIQRWRTYQEDSSFAEDSDRTEGSEDASTPRSPIWARVFVLLLLLSLGCLVGVFIHRYASEQEREGYTSSVSFRSVFCDMMSLFIECMF